MPTCFYIGENCFPDFNVYDYAIGFEDFQFEDRYIRFPRYASYYNSDCDKMVKMTLYSDGSLDNRCFCSIVVSNAEYADPYRIDLFNALSKNFFVASGGRLLNNIGHPEGIKDKEVF